MFNIIFMFKRKTDIIHIYFRLTNNLFVIIFEGLL